MSIMKMKIISRICVCIEINHKERNKNWNYFQTWMKIMCHHQTHCQICKVF